MASVLETFLIQFSTNGEEAVKDTKKVEGALEDLARSAAGMVAGFLSVGALINGIFSASKMANDLGDLSEVIGISAQELSVWGDAVAASGGTAEGFYSSVQGMTDDFVQLSTVGKSRLLPFFQALGIEVTDANGKVRDVMDVLPELADAFSQMTKQEAVGFGRKLGLDMGTIRLLQQGRREVDAVIARQKELGVVSAKQVEIAKANDDAMDDLSHAYRTFSLALGEAVLPPITWFLNKLSAFTVYMAEHKDVVIYILTGLAAAAAVMGASFALAFAPVLLVLGAIALFAMAVEDIVKFIEGGDSLTGRMFAWMNQFKAFRVVVDFLVKSLKGLGMIWDAIKGLGIFSSGSEGVKISQNAVLGLAQGKEAIGLATSTPLAALSGSVARASATNNKTVNMPIQNITVQTQATDAVGISKSISGTLGAHMQQAVANYDDGVAA